MLCLFGGYHAQNTNCHASLEGAVIDEHNHSPLEFATLYIIELKIGLISDSIGRFKFENICEGHYHIKISHLDCEAITQTVQISGKTVQNFYLEHHAHALKSVNVLILKNDITFTQTKDAVSVEKMNQSKGQTLGETLKNISGISSLNTGNSVSKPVIHGMHSNRILILNNGVRQEGQQWGAEHAPEIDPFIASSISVVKGANSVRYGSDAIAGVILIDTKKLRDSAGINGELNLIGMSNGKAGTASAFIEGNFDKIKALSWRIQGTLKQSGSIHSPNYNLANTGMKEQNFSYALAWKKTNYGIDLFYSQFNTTLGILSASHIGNLSDLQTAFTASVPAVTGNFSYNIDRPFQHIEHELFKVNSFVRTGSIGKLNLVYARQYNLRYEYDKYRPLNTALAAMNKPELQFEITSHSADLIWEHNRIHQLNGCIGISGLSQANTYEGRYLVPNFKNYTAGMFWIERWKKNKFEIEGGLRYDYKHLQVFKYADDNNIAAGIIKPIRLFQNISSNLGSIYKVDSSLLFSFNIGTAWRAPSVNELYANGLHQGAASLEYGNSALQLEKAYTAIFTMRYQKQNKYLFELTPYYNYIQNLIYRKPAESPILTIRGAFPAFYYQQTNAILKGFDVFAKYFLTKSIEVSEKASILRAWNVNDNNWLIMMPADRFETELLKRFRKKNDAYLAASFLFVNKQWRVPANSDFVAPPAQYFLFNLQAAYTLHIKQQSLNIGFGINNLFNKAYRDYLDRFRYYTDAMGRNYSIRITIPFNNSFNKHLKNKPNEIN